MRLSRNAIKHKVEVDAIKHSFKKEIQQTSNDTACGKCEKLLREGMKYLVL